MSDAEILAEIRAIRREYARNWRKKNPQRVKEHNERYWRKRAENKLLQLQVQKG